MMFYGTTVLIILALMMCWALLSHGVPTIDCNGNGITDLNTTAAITCSFQGPATIYYDTPQRKGGAYCTERMSCNSTTSRHNIRLVDINTTRLDIQTVQSLDEGSWSCRNPNTLEESSCTLLLRNIPTCSIKSENRLDNLHVGETISLSVYLKNYYCSKLSAFFLQTGNVTHELMKNISSNALEKHVFNVSFSLSNSHAGSVAVVFMCSDVPESMSCEGVDTLVIDIPTCSIKSENRLDNLHVGETISLSVYLKNYYCPEPFAFVLQTGNVTHELMKNNSINALEMHVFNVSFSLSNSHAGFLALVVMCGDVPASMSCEGVNTLVIVSETSDELPAGSQLMVILVACFTTLVIVVAIVCILYLCRKGILHLPGRRKKALSGIERANNNMNSGTSATRDKTNKDVETVRNGDSYYEEIGGENCEKSFDQI